MTNPIQSAHIVFVAIDSNIIQQETKTDGYPI